MINKNDNNILSLCFIYYYQPLYYDEKEYGYNCEDVVSLSALCEENECYGDNLSLSFLHIDDKYNIILPLYDNAVIQMEPLPKSLYILFLRHPEGILLKEISNYRDEIECIYRKVSGRQNPTVIHRLLDDVTDPTNNMLHKNLSIIRSAFLRKLCVNVAEHYIPIRNRAHEQYISLDSSLIKLPQTLQ